MFLYNGRMQIALDGPAGVGKSTVARRLAERLGWLYVNTGAMYRAMAWALDRGLALAEVDIQLGKKRVWVNGKDVTDQLYTATIDRLTSQQATRADVRARLIELQQAIARDQDVVMEGRDIGTVVLPEADLKIYLMASPQERAQRRARQRGQDAAAVQSELDERDARDREGFGRHPAQDAVRIDTDGLSVDEVVGCVLDRLKKREGAGNL